MAGRRHICERRAESIDWDEWLSRHNLLSRDGLHLTDVAPYRDDTGLHFAAVWRPGTGAQWLFKGRWWEFLLQHDGLTARGLSGQGLRLVDLETYVEHGQRRFAGVWRAGNDAHHLWVGATLPGIRAKDCGAGASRSAARFVSCL